MKKRQGLEKSNQSRKYKIITFVICLIIVILISSIGSLFTSKRVNSLWYETNKPSITPPNFVFPIVWTILFFLIALSMYFSWINAKSKSDKKMIILAFGINFIFNVSWSFLFFNLGNPFYGFIDIIILWFSIIFCMTAVWRISRASFWLLLPYLLWVSFAGVLNYLFLV
jgi:tryptophan-rich sensory protein